MLDNSSLVTAFAMWEKKRGGGYFCVLFFVVVLSVFFDFVLRIERGVLLYESIRQTATHNRGFGSA